jgi:transcriptional regulator with XRE-family HTH domain
MPRRFRNSIGPTVRRLRIERGLTHDQLAARLILAGLETPDRFWVLRVESQYRSIYDFELAVIAAVLGVTADDLLPGGKELKKDLPALHKGER